MGADLTIALPSGDVWTWEDLQAVPDEAYHYFQLIEGQILMSPSPNRRHQTCVVRLVVALERVVPPELELLVAPFDFVPEPMTSLQPDLVILRRGTAEANRTVVAPVLAIEVLSPSTRTFDLTAKRALYERFGVAHYWIVDPDGPTVLALTLDADGRYVESAAVSGTDAFETAEPFAVELAPAELVTD
ncbi:MAG: Uma2 family endonuclease [Gaiellaceae bacterium]